MSFAKKENIFICGLQQPFVVDDTFLFSLSSPTFSLGEGMFLKSIT